MDEKQFNDGLIAFIDHVNDNLVKPYYARMIEGAPHMREHWQDNVVRAQQNNSKNARYIRLVRVEKGLDRSVYCFVDTTNGDLLKGSWKAPVKNGVRGNIFDSATYANFNHYGPNYLK